MGDNASNKLTIPGTVMARQVGDELVILDLASGTYFGLDPLGTHIWQMIAQGRTLPEICDGITREYQVERADFERDLAALIADLDSHGLVKLG